MKEKTKVEIWVFCLYAYGILVGGLMTPATPWWGMIALALPAVFAANKVMSFFKK